MSRAWVAAAAFSSAFRATGPRHRRPRAARSRCRGRETGCRRIIGVDPIDARAAADHRGPNLGRRAGTRPHRSQRRKGPRLNTRDDRSWVHDLEKNCCEFVYKPGRCSLRPFRSQRVADQTQRMGCTAPDFLLIYDPLKRQKKSPVPRRQSNEQTDIAGGDPAWPSWRAAAVWPPRRWHRRPAAPRWRPRSRPPSGATSRASGRSIGGPISTTRGTARSLSISPRAPCISGPRINRSTGFTRHPFR
jgi:hypothetical protein